MGKNQFALYILGFLFSLLFISNGKATNYQDIIINEIMWSGSTISSADEWIELKNTTTHDIDISGYKINYLKNNIESLMLEIPSGVIPAEGYFLISNNAENHKFSKGESILNVAPDLINNDVVLSNDKLQLFIYDVDGQLLDIAGDGKDPLAGDNNNKYSMQRNKIFADGTVRDNWHTAIDSINFDDNSLEKGSPKAVNNEPDKELFSSPGTYSDLLSQYFNYDFVLETNVQVTKVIDGDTIEVVLNGKNQTVRFVGVDCPEGKMSSNFNIDEPYFLEAKKFTETLQDKNIKILVNKIESERFDQYDRLLAIVINDEKVFNISLLQQGLARTYLLSNPTVNDLTWPDTEDIAKNNQIGIWQSLKERESNLINELMINPTGNDTDQEWIELYNPNEKNINLSNWLIDDQEGGSKPYLLPIGTIINSHEYLVLPISQTNIVLNNSSDSVRLFTPDLFLSEEITYKKSKENYSYSRTKDQSWQWTNILTPWSENIISQDSVKINKPTKSSKNNVDLDNLSLININEAKKQANNQWVKVKGVVTAKPGTFSQKYFYIQDNSAGLQIYSYKEQFPDLEIGDEIVIVGKISTTKPMKLKTYGSDYFSVVGKNEINAQEINLSDINEEKDGQLINISGQIEKSTSVGFYLKNQDNPIRITIKKATGFKKPKTKKNDWSQVVGIVVCEKDNCTVWPRALDDLVIVEKIVSKKTKTISKISTPSLLMVKKIPVSDQDNFFQFMKQDFKFDNQINQTRFSTIGMFFGIIFTCVLAILFLGKITWNLLVIHNLKLKK